jgi:hypothetical protein
LKIFKAVIKVPTQFVVVTVYEKSMKIPKVLIKVPSHFVVTVYEKSLKITKAVITTNCVGTLISALDIVKLFSYTVTTKNCVGTLITALDIFKLFSYKKSLKISKAVIRIPTQFVVTV